MAHQSGASTIAQLDIDNVRVTDPDRLVCRYIIGHYIGSAIDETLNANLGGPAVTFKRVGADLYIS